MINCVNSLHFEKKMYCSEFNTPDFHLPLTAQIFLYIVQD